MSSSIIDFVNCHTEKELGNNKYINDKFLDVKELNGETIYQNNVLIATQTDIDFLQQEIDNISPSNPNVWVNGAGETTTNQQILFTDNSVNGAITSDKLYFDTENNFIYLNGEPMPVKSEIDDLQTQIYTVSNQSQNNNNQINNLIPRVNNVEVQSQNNNNQINNLIPRVNNVEVQSQNNNNQIQNLLPRTLYLETLTAQQQTDIINLQSNVSNNTTNISSLETNISTLQTNIITNTNDIIGLQGDFNNLETYTANSVSSLQGDISTLQTDVSTNSNNITTLQGQVSTNTSNITTLQGQVSTNSSNITTNTSNIYQLQVQTTILNTYANSAMLKAMNCNNFIPTGIYNIVWNNLTPEEKLMWKGGDNTTIDPIQSTTGNYWNFTKTLVNTNKIGWYIPVNLSGLTFQDLESFWCVIRFNSLTNISSEGSLYFQITTSPATAPNTFRTRINYSNPATVMNQTGYFYKIYAIDTITTLTTSNLGKGQEIGQQKFKMNPMNVRSDLWSIGFNKLVASPTGDTSAGYTLAPIQSISLQTASNINTFNFDVVSIGYLDKQYNLFYS